MRRSNGISQSCYKTDTIYRCLTGTRRNGELSCGFMYKPDSTENGWSFLLLLARIPTGIWPMSGCCPISPSSFRRIYS